MLNKRFGTAIRKIAKKGFRGHPIATIAYYGPDASHATKVVVGIKLAEGQSDGEMDYLERWTVECGDARTDTEINEAILDMLRAHTVRSVVMVDRMLGCPHEEGVDYPEGSKCPQCPYWANRDRYTGEVIS